MESVLTIIAPVVAVGLLYVVAPVVAHTYQRLRKPRTVICPETGAPAEIQLDASLAATSAAVGRMELRVTGCSRWTNGHVCDQDCRNQVG